MKWRVAACLLVSAVFLAAGQLAAQERTGTLVFDVKPFQADVKIKKKLLEELQTGSVRWGIEADQLVVSFVGEQPLAFPVPNLTTYGSEKRLELAPGSYRISCVGFVPIVDPEDENALEEGAYVNPDYLSFTVAPGKVTRLELRPSVQKFSTLFEKYDVPDLMMYVIEDGVPLSNRVINAKTATSIPWSIYDGPLRKR